MSLFNVYPLYEMTPSHAEMCYVFDKKGNKYVGEWKNNQKSGQGTYTDDIGHRYTGNWKKGKRDGEGTYSFAGQKKSEDLLADNLFFGGTMHWIFLECQHQLFQF